MAVPTRPKNTAGHSIIDLTITTPALGFVAAWSIDPEYATPSDHELITFDLENLDFTQGSLGPSKEVTGWALKDLTTEQEKNMEDQWKAIAEEHPAVSTTSRREELDLEAQWISDTLAQFFDHNCKPLRIRARSKRWWSEDKNIKFTEMRITPKEEHEGFLGNDSLHHAQKWQDDNDRCWTALRYTKSWSNSATPALRDPAGQIPTTFEEKEEMIRRVMYPERPDKNLPELTHIDGTTHKKVTREVVQKALFHQSTTKAPGSDRINFRALRLLWKWDSERIVRLIRQCVRSGHHPHSWRTAKGILLRKPNKVDYRQVKSCRITSLLNSLGKVTEKVVAELIAESCELRGTLHQGQMGYRKQRSCIDAVARVMSRVEEVWSRGNIAALLLMDVKGAFDHVIKKKASEKNAGNRNRQQPDKLGRVSTGIPQGSPVSPILFTIYTSGVFQKVEDEVDTCQLTSFADDCGFLVEASTVRELTERIERAEIMAIEWGQENCLDFDHAKTEAVVFTKRRKIRSHIQQASAKIKDVTIKFNKEATRWLGLWLDSALSFREHKDTYLQKARRAEARLKAVTNRKGLEPGLVWKIQVAAVQSVALYGAELWWRNQKSWADEHQKLVNRQGRTITGMFRRRARPAWKIKSGDWDRLEDHKAKTLGQRLANSLSDSTVIEKSYGLEYTRRVEPACFLGVVDVPNSREAAEDKARQHHDQEGELSFWTDGSKLDSQKTGAGVAWKNVSGNWECRKFYLGKNKEVFDAELYAVDQALEIALRGGRNKGRRESLVTNKILEELDRIHIWLDSCAAIKRMQHLEPGPGQWLACQIRRRMEDLKKYHITVYIHWVPRHAGIEENELADRTAKEAAKHGTRPRERFTSLAHMMRRITERKREECHKWFNMEQRKRKSESRNTYKLVNKNHTVDRIASKARKKLAGRYYQLKSGHAFKSEFLHRIGKSISKRCSHCSHAAS
ncbi:hypothetical protein K3495_g8523 [Podosphaera aphanis]|nr:hypothetical protein K3495_g8523 [Podosphaera aphanis]